MALPLLGIGAYAAGSALSALLVRVLTWVLIAKGAAVVIRVFGTLGIAYFTYDLILEPAINLADNYWAAMPAQLVQWVRAFGVMECASIIVSAYLIAVAQRIFLGKRS